MIACPVCDKEFEPCGAGKSAKKYCSVPCRDRAQNSRSLGTPLRRRTGPRGVQATETRERRASEGKCRNCDDPAESGSLSCFLHGEKTRLQAAVKRARARKRDDLPDRLAALEAVKAQLAEKRRENLRVEVATLRAELDAAVAARAEEKAKRADAKRTQSPAAWLHKTVKRSVERAAKRGRRGSMAIEAELLAAGLPERCPVLGYPLNYGRGFASKDRRHSPSIDQIAPGAGYEPGNVEIISLQANTMMNDGTPRERIAVGVYEMSRHQDPAWLGFLANGGAI